MFLQEGANSRSVNFMEAAMTHKFNNRFGHNYKNALEKKLLFLLSMSVIMMACDNHEIHYTYYDDAKNIIKEKYEVDKSTGKKDGEYKRYNKKGNLIYNVKYVDDELQVNYFVDERDGRKYKITTIGNQTWMAENLNFAIEGCYGESLSNCEKYGRMYDWEKAKIACPAGWHLPSKDEFESLFLEIGKKEVEVQSAREKALKFNETLRKMGLPEEDIENISEDSVITNVHWIDVALSLKSTSGWKKNGEKNGDGVDAYGFTAIPAGSVFFEEVGSSWSEIGESTYFWSSTKEKDDYAYYMMLGLDSDKAYLGYADVGYSRYSVRCIKD
jgi:hypothetical protein